eukprot:TRINITY_DN75048_c0_g1_i1.p1 TRINITY_DN75048_c0_g1~~TRINITY_DN75048_c0_g1_i1.p1  ORF type:complete len:308 (-),score=39.11 TRINITY_DN75048_c0_g1_i1:89-1012(-)
MQRTTRQTKKQKDQADEQPCTPKKSRATRKRKASVALIPADQFINAFAAENKLKRMRRREPVKYDEEKSVMSNTMSNLFWKNTKSIGCTFQHHGYTLTTVFSDPGVYTVENFLSKQEVADMMTLIKKRKQAFKDSQTIDTISSTKELYRTSETLMFKKRQNEIVRLIEERAAALLEVDPTTVEPIQCVGYTNGQQYKLHHDAGTLKTGGKVSVVPPRRVFTAFVYLTSMKKGMGCTEFPKLALPSGKGKKKQEQCVCVQPEAGKAVLWCNVLEGGEADPRLVHAALPVPKGHQKYGINVWVMEHAWA